ncbi:cation diffusion facilitator family transporter [Clostridium sp. MSJ-11]|uniref:Cation diffusion facilitator family transporter n=1 Tax=Clostridium mobile TaxID=2841512 RepID=A0ABS6EEI0_9CLOT|nr:cation diffusion facilitator family transporter [Clostridium mobile]MBU5483608.1 cation diffusion facilitator family transporter [Clostridium mobile]
MDNVKVGTRASWISIGINLVLSLLKLAGAILGKSTAMLADTVHSLADIVTTLVVIIGLKISNKDADENHPYGHEKFESIFTKIISLLLIFTGVSIGYKGVVDSIRGNLSSPGKIALIAAATSIIVKECLYWYTLMIARKIKSTSMEADAWHHRSDAISSIATFIGILGARMGFKILDPIAAILVCIIIVKVGVEYYLKAVKELVDHTASNDIIDRIKELSSDIEGVIKVNSLKTRIFGNKVYADVGICVDKNISIEEGHKIAETVHTTIENNIENIKHCSVYIIPN